MTSCPLSSFTRQRASGSTSATTPSNSSISSLAMHAPGLASGAPPLWDGRTEEAVDTGISPAVYGPVGHLPQAKIGLAAQVSKARKVPLTLSAPPRCKARARSVTCARLGRHPSFSCALWGEAPAGFVGPCESADADPGGGCL